MKKVILVFKTHFDIGFTDLAENVIRQYADTMLSDVLKTCGATEHMGKLKYVWTMPAWPLKQVVDTCTGKRQEELFHYIKNGQVAWHGLPFTSHVDFCGEEEYVQGLSYAKALSDQFQKPYPIAAKMTDVPGHGLMLPEILAASGIRFLHLGCNAFATGPAVPDLFYWQAKSGRKLLTMYCRGGYGSDLKAPKGWEFPVWMALVHTHDNCGPHSAEFIQKLVQEAQQLYPEADIVCGTMDDFCKELEKCDLSSLPVVDQDLSDSWIHGIGAYPAEVGKMRSLRHRSTMLSKQYLQLRSAGVSAEAVEEYRKIYYENAHLFGEHTWGADVKTWLGPDRVYKKEDFLAAKQQENYCFMERSWEEQRERAANCEQALKQWEKAMTQGKDLIYNPSLMSYSGWVEVEQPLVLGGEELVMSEIFGKTSCYVSNLPAMASAAVKTVKGATPPIKRQLKLEKAGALSYVENHRYRLMFQAETGKIVSLIDLKKDSILLKEQGERGIFTYEYTRHGMVKMTEFLRSYGYRFSAWGIQDYGREAYPECEDETCQPVFDRVEVDGDTVSFIYKNGDSVRAYGNAAQISIRVTLPPKGDELFVEVVVTDKQESPYLESGSFCIALPKGEKEYRVNKNGSVIDPRQEICSQANHVYYALEDFVAADSGKNGICVIPLDTPLLSIGEDGMYIYRSDYQEKEDVFFFNLFNNMWGTNFPQWQGGDYRFRFILFGYDKTEKEALYPRSNLLTEGAYVIHSEIESPDMVLPESMQLLNMWLESGDRLLMLRDLSGTADMEQIEAFGYKIVEIDFFGREIGAGQENKISFSKLKYGLHIFKLSKISFV